MPRWDLQLRMALTALLVVTLTAAASRFGPVAGGVLAALPVLASILAVFTHARYGAAAVVDLLRGMLGGMAGFVAFCALVAVLVEPLGIAASFAVATVAALAIQGTTAWAARRAPATPAPTRLRHAPRLLGRDGYPSPPAWQTASTLLPSGSSTNAP